MRVAPSPIRFGFDGTVFDFHHFGQEQVVLQFDFALPLFLEVFPLRIGSEHVLVGFLDDVLPLGGAGDVVKHCTVAGEFVGVFHFLQFILEGCPTHNNKTNEQGSAN